MSRSDIAPEFERAVREGGFIGIVLLCRTLF